MTMTLTYAPEAYKLLRGILAVYKPSDTSINALLDGFGEKILLGIAFLDCLHCIAVLWLFNNYCKPS